jgi:hypothetical protein
MKQAGFHEPVIPGCFSDGHHRYIFRAMVAPKDCRFVTPADGQKTFGLDGDFGSLVHRDGS